MQRKSSTPRLDRLYGGYLLAEDGLPHDSETFIDWEKWLVEEGFHGSLEPLHSTNSLKQRIRDIEDARATPEGRVFLTMHDPLSWALQVQPHHLTNPDTNEIGFNDFLLWMAREAYLWQWSHSKLRMAVGNELGSRFKALIVGRGLMKTTATARIFPMWAAAHKHINLYAFAAANKEKLSETQTWWLDELEGNEQIIADYPDFVMSLPKKAGFLDQVNGFTMITRSLGMEWRGTNAHGRRPDLGVTDDIDAPDPGGIEDREKMLTKDYQHTSRRMRAYLLGTNRGPGNITDSLVTKFFRGQEAAKDFTRTWDPIHFSATPTSRISGRERSIGEAFIKYNDGSPDCLVRMRKEDPTYDSEIENLPYSNNGVWWTKDDIHLLTEPQIRARFTYIAVSVDPAGGGSGARSKQDSTGITVTAFDPKTLDSCVIFDTGGPWDALRIRQELLKIENRFHPNIGYWEGNFGGANNMEGTVAPSGQGKWVTRHGWKIIYQSKKTGYAGSEYNPASKEARFSGYLRLFRARTAAGPTKVYLLGIKRPDGEIECALPAYKAQLLAYDPDTKVKGMKDKVDSGATATKALIEQFKTNTNPYEGTGF